MFMRLLAVVAAMVLAMGSAAWAQDAYKTDSAGYIPYWVGVGPIPIDGKEAGSTAAGKDYLNGEAAIAPVPGDALTIDGKEYKWKLITSKDGSPVVDSDAAFGKAGSCLAYMVAYVVMDKDDPKASVYWGTDDNGAAYVNGKCVGQFSWGGGRGYTADADLGENVGLKKGVNVIIVKIVNVSNAYSGAMRLVDSQGSPIVGATILPAPAGKKAPNGDKWPLVKTATTAPAVQIAPCLVASQIGYNTGEEKLAIAAGPKEMAWKSITICDAKTNEKVFEIPTDGGSIQPVGSRYDTARYITRVYFGQFKKPGRYYLSGDDNKVKSLGFNIADDVFVPLAGEVTRMFYFQRVNQDFDEKTAGKWAGKAVHDIENAKKATVNKFSGGNWLSVGKTVVDPTLRDIHGGWYDAGDPNKYTKNESYAHNLLLLTYDMNSKYLKDDQLNIPESGNKIPDLLDETRYATEYLLRIQREDGAVFDRVAHGDGNGIPQIAEPCSGATLCAIGAWAWAGAVWQETTLEQVGPNPKIGEPSLAMMAVKQTSPLDKDFAAKCIAAAEKSWAYMEKNPAPWPKDLGKTIGSIDGSYGDEKALRALAAATLFRATGKAEYRKVAEEYLNEVKDVRSQWNAREMMWSGQVLTVFHNYSLGKNPDAKLVERYVKQIAADAAVVRDDVSAARHKHLWGSGSRDAYYWGVCGSISMSAGWMGWYANRFAPESEKASYAQAAGEYLQFIAGRNPTQWCFVTNISHIGAEHSLPIMFHFEMMKGDKWKNPDASHPSRIGCFPGYVVGGPAYGPENFKFNYDQPDWVQMEPSIMYQAPLVMLANYCAYAARDDRAAKKDK